MFSVDFNDYSHMLLASLALTCILGITMTFIRLIYVTFIRPRRQVEVNCWFCQEDTTVLYSNINSWNCPSCNQYNGFTEDGDYNRPIMAQFKEFTSVNHQSPPSSCRSSDKFSTCAKKLCHSCNQKQTLKVRQLANYVPYNEDNYDLEIQKFQMQIEKSYELCSMCRELVKEEIDSQDKILRKNLFGNAAAAAPLLTENNHHSNFTDKSGSNSVARYFESMSLGRPSSTTSNTIPYPKSNLGGSFSNQSNISNSSSSVFNPSSTTGILRPARFIGGAPSVTSSKRSATKWEMSRNKVCQYLENHSFGENHSESSSSSSRSTQVQAVHTTSPSLDESLASVHSRITSLEANSWMKSTFIQILLGVSIGVNFSIAGYFIFHNSKNFNSLFDFS
ncbi:uncharacterized protein LOC141908845 [Tubulanus polymorphus]|uniref:uncharacterized protein LOC141908845 n=1 Tax=Tubulanus polymorphus TaxID=672921 RepID=UPI003DA5AFB6